MEKLWFAGRFQDFDFLHWPHRSRCDLVELERKNLRGNGWKPKPVHWYMVTAAPTAVMLCSRAVLSRIHCEPNRIMCLHQLLAAVIIMMSRWGQASLPWWFEPDCLLVLSCDSHGGTHGQMRERRNLRYCFVTSERWGHRLQVGGDSRVHSTVQYSSLPSVQASSLPSAVTRRSRHAETCLKILPSKLVAFDVAR